MQKQQKQILKSHINKTGSLKLIIGPMYAGKSTELIRYYRLYKFQKC